MADQAVNGDPTDRDTEVPETAEIKLVFNPTNQTCVVTFDPQEMKTWEFVLAIIEMGKTYATQMRNMQVAAQLQHQAMQQQAALINEHQQRKVLFKGK